MIVLDHWKNISDAKKASLALLFAMIFQNGISMISMPIFTRIMDIEQYGAITNFISWQSIIMIISTLNLSQGVFNNGMMDFRDEREKFTASVLVLANISTIICFGIYLILHSVLSPVIDLPDSLMLLMLLYMLFYPAYSFWSCRQRYEFKYKLLTLSTMLITISQMAAGIMIVLIVPTNQQALSKIFVTEIVLIFAGLILYINILIKSRFVIKFEYVKYAFKFNIFLLPHFLAMNVLASGDKVMINSMVGKTETAIYGVSYTAASVITIFWQAIEASWTPWLFEQLNSGNRKSIKKRASQIISFFAVVSISCMLLAPEIMIILASSDYLEGVYIIPSVTTGVYFISVYALYMRLEYYSKKTKATMIGSIAVAVANVALNYIFIRIFGYLAAGYTTLACYMLLYLFHFWYSRKIGMRSIYDDRYILGLSLSMIAISVMVVFTYNINILRYMIIIVLLILCAIFRKKVMSQINSALK